MFNRLSQKHVDFVLVGVDDAQVKLVIELDDKTHLKPQRRDRDALVDEILTAAGIPIIRFWVAAGYDAELLRLRIAECVPGEHSFNTSAV